MYTSETIQSLSDAQLATLAGVVRDEQARRQDLAALPGLIEATTQRFVNQGGDKAKIRPPSSYVKGPPPAATS